jgi:hypothetical protein
MVKKIELTQGKYALVDDEDFEYLNQWKWHYHSSGYARRTDYPIGNTIFMHRVVNKTADGYETDHKDGNRLNNQKANLRSCNSSQNKMNRRNNKESTSRFKGVFWNSQKGKWASTINNPNQKHVGYFNDEEDAARAYDKAAVEYFGEFAYLNFKETT